MMPADPSDPQPGPGAFAPEFQLLREAGRLFALAGGWRKPGGRLNLSRAKWVCGPFEEKADRD
jgi:hypothetical protein